MPLVERARSALVVVDTQPGFVEQSAHDQQEQLTSAATVERIAWLCGIAALLDVPAVVVEEGPDCAGSTIPQVLGRLPQGTAVVSKTTFTLTGSPQAMDAVRASSCWTSPRGKRGVLDHDHQGLARMFHAGVERIHCKGLFFEWAHTVQPAIETSTLAKSKFGDHPVRL
jgi:nicotinamidase-related amidase